MRRLQDVGQAAAADAQHVPPRVIPGDANVGRGRNPGKGPMDRPRPFTDFGHICKLLDIARSMDVLEMNPGTD